MGNFLNVQICENGHIISPDIEMYSFHFCPQCGTKTFSSCPSCGEPIFGKYFEYDVLFTPEFPDQVPFYCHNCGKPYPWTQKIIDNAVEILALDEDLDSDTKSIIKNAIPNLLVDTPETPVSITKFRSAMSKAGEIVQNSMCQLLSDVIVKSAKGVFFS